MEIYSKMRFYGEIMSDVAIMEKILRPLCSKFNYVICSIDESKDIKHLSFDQSLLVLHEHKKNHISNSNE